MQTQRRYKLADYCLAGHTDMRAGRAIWKVTPWRDRINFLLHVAIVSPLVAVDRKMHFTGLRGAMWRFVGITRGTKNPNVCNSCGGHFEKGRLAEVTVLFADWRGFTTYMREMGPQVVQPLIDELFRVCREIVIDHDGIVDHFLGDAVMAFFNVPITREDHIEQAIAAATQMQLAARKVTVPGTAERPIRLGIGISTGLAVPGVVGSDNCSDYTVIGDTVNLAARLQGEAGPGEVVVTEEVYEQVRDAFPNAQERVLALKGYEDPVRGYVLT